MAMVNLAYQHVDRAIATPMGLIISNASFLIRNDKDIFSLII